MSNTFPHSGEDNSLAREGSRQQRAEAQRLRDIKATVIHYMTMLHVALNDDFGLDSLEIKGLVEKYYRLPPLPKS